MANSKNDHDSRQGGKHSTVHDEIVERIVKKNKALSHSIWTDEPVLKPKKSVWLDIDEDNDKAETATARPAPNIDEPKAEPVQKPTEVTAEKADSGEVIIPFSMEKDHISGTKKEISVELSSDGKMRKLPNKKNLTLTIPDESVGGNGTFIAGKRVEIIDKRSPVKEKKAENPNRIEATINVRLPKDNKN